MQPVAGELLSSRVGAALGDLVLMMRENQIHSTSVYIEHIGAQPFANELERHSRALDMPARPAPAERGIPCGAHCLVFGSRRFPQHEITSILFGVLVGAHPLAAT